MPATPADFEAMYDRDEDPWGFRTRWYERRKYAITVASLPRERYRQCWEPACSIGVLSATLATRSDRLQAGDASRTAIAAARRMPLPEDAGHVEFEVRPLPEPPPLADGGCDLVVLSEILFYLAPEERRATLDLARRLLAPGGDLVTVHWAPRPHDGHLSGVAVQEWVIARPGWQPLVHHRDEHFVLDVLRRN